MKITFYILLMSAVALAIIIPEAPERELTKSEVKYGTQPYNFSSFVKIGMKKWRRDTKDVKCYSVVLSPKHDGYIAVCDYKIQNRYRGYDLKSNRFIYNGAKGTMKMIAR